MKKAMYYTAEENMMVRCNLCPHRCGIVSGHYGRCGVRLNQGGVLISENYGMISAAHLDPIEKKPLFHFYPGKMIYSIGSVGCNLACKFCQNWEISQAEVGSKRVRLLEQSPKQVVRQALSLVDMDNIGIAYTYNEPIVWYEFMLDCAKEAAKNGLKNVMVSNGYIEDAPLRKLLPHIDAFNIDLKSFDDNFYKSITRAHLDPVLRSLKQIHASGKHLEVTFLVIPNENDETGRFSEMCAWIGSELGTDTPLHINRYFPMYKMDREATSIETLSQLSVIAGKILKHVYIGNV